MTKQLMEIETPCFILDKKKLDDNINNIRNGISIFNKATVAYSVKTNSNPWLLKYISESTNFYLEVVSPEEYYYIIELGVKPNRIIYNGPCKDIDTLRYALMNGSIVNIDTYHDVNIIKHFEFDFSVGLRVNVTYGSSQKNDEIFGYEESRFGFSYENGNLKEVINVIKSNQNIKINGLHFHLNNKKRSVFNSINIAQIASKIINEYELNLDYIDFGGGYKGGKGNDFTNYTSTVYENMNIENKEDINYIFEPGAAIIATPISYLTRIFDIHEINNKKYIVLDGGRTHIDPTFSNKKYVYSIISNEEEIEKKPQIITGFSCMENDRLIIINNGKKLIVGDMLEFENLGAYTMTLMPCFIKGYPKVYLKENENFKIIQESKSIIDILGGQNERVYRKIR